MFRTSLRGSYASALGRWVLGCPKAAANPWGLLPLCTNESRATGELRLDRGNERNPVKVIIPALIDK